ncbi:MAG: hypothetical protein KM310_05565 [Clostridiales bacterium]|nr:hypothetical protein [Clostridiales bacterium]
MSSVYLDAEHPVEIWSFVRRLPLPGEILVAPGDEVEPEQTVARISLRPGIPWVIPLARLIGVRDDQLSQCCLVKVGDRVKTKQVIARGLSSGLYGQKEYESPIDGVVEDISDRSGRIVIREEFGREEPPVKVDVAFELGVRPRDLPQHMLFKVGQEVKKGSILAKKGEQQAFFTRSVVAPVSGVVAEINTQTGHVTIARPFKEVVVKAYVRGRVKDVQEQRAVVVETAAVRLTGIFGLGGERHGRLKVLVSSPYEDLTPDLIDESCRGQIIVGGRLATDEALMKALEVGVAGVITGTAHYLTLVKALGVKLGVGITGSEDVDMTVILMEGFGSLPMRESAFRTLRSLDGREASINGATQIRAGAIRPEIVVPMPWELAQADKRRFVDEDLTIGQKVRIITEPYFGLVGVVAALPREDAIIETEAKAAVAQVDVGGRLLTVPRKNLEPFH